MAMKSGVPGSLRRRVMRECNYTCAVCGLVGWESRGSSFTFPTPIANVWLSIDHITPRSRGGASTRGNLRVLCTTCNTQKGSRMGWLDSAPEEHW